MRTLFVALCTCALLMLAPSSSHALPAGGGGTGGGDSTIDCWSCYRGGGWTPGGIHWTSCMRNVGGAGGECKVVNNQCVYDSGCKCVPEGVDPGVIYGMQI